MGLIGGLEVDIGKKTFKIATSKNLTTMIMAGNTEGVNGWDGVSTPDDRSAALVQHEFHLASDVWRFEGSMPGVSRHMGVNVAGTLAERRYPVQQPICDDGPFELWNADDAADRTVLEAVGLHPDGGRVVSIRTRTSRMSLGLTGNDQDGEDSE